MRDQDDTPYIVLEREGAGGLGSFVLGALVGAGLALLFAPQSGEETQEEIKTKALKFKDVAQERVRDAQNNFEGRLTVARENVQARVESVREAVDSGRHAAARLEPTSRGGWSGPRRHTGPASKQPGKSRSPRTLLRKRKSRRR